jgi:hypothetical protein
MFSATKTPIEYQELFKYISEDDILLRYLDIPQIPCLINSPLRDDKNPSFSVYYDKKTGRRHWKDFGNNENGGLLDLLMRIYNLSFKELINKIRDDFYFDTSGVERIQLRNSHIYHKHVFDGDIKLDVKVRDWKEWDIEYWNSYGISIELLEKARVYPISHIFVEKQGRTMIINSDKYAYVYVEFKDDIPTYKVYQPYSTKYKWLNQHDSSVWSLWRMLPPTGEKLIITSSTKDALCLIQNIGIPSCSLQAESYIPKPHVIQELKDRFKDIYILYDNDFTKEVNYGHQYGEKIAKTFNLKQIEIPTEYKSKDPSDLFKNCGKKVFIEVISKLII